MMDKNILKHLIETSLNKIGVDSLSAVNLMLGTCAVESNFGEYLKQINGPALGIYQIEPNTEKDIWENYLKYHNNFKNIIINDFKIKTYGTYEVQNFGYQTIIAFLCYYRKNKNFPEHDDIEGLANFWKKYYNTYMGKGKIQDFINKYKIYVLKEGENNERQ